MMCGAQTQPLTTPGLTFGQGEGYVIAKATVLADTLTGVLSDALDLPAEVTFEISHELVEDGIDLLVKAWTRRSGKNYRPRPFPAHRTFPSFSPKPMPGTSPNLPG